MCLYDDIAALVRRQLSDNGSWNVVQYSVTGTAIADPVFHE